MGGKRQGAHGGEPPEWRPESSGSRRTPELGTCCAGPFLSRGKHTYPKLTSRNVFQSMFEILMKIVCVGREVIGIPMQAGTIATVNDVEFENSVLISNKTNLTLTRPPWPHTCR